MLLGKITKASQIVIYQLPNVHLQFTFSKPSYLKKSCAFVSDFYFFCQFRRNIEKLLTLNFYLTLEVNDLEVNDSQYSYFDYKYNFIFLRFKVVYLVLYMFKSINIKEKTSNTKTVSYNMGSSPFGLQCHWGSCDC